MFCCYGCRVYTGMCCKWLRNQGTPWSTTLFDFTPTSQHEKYSLHLILTFFLNKDPYRCQNYSLSLHFSKKNLHVGPFTGNRNRLWNCWVVVERSKMTSVSIRIIANQTMTHIITINQHNSVLHAFSVPNWSELCGVVDDWQFFYNRPPGKFQYTAGEIVKMWCQELHTHTHTYIYIYIYIYYPLDNRCGFSISVQPEITPLLQFIFNV